MGPWSACTRPTSSSSSLAARLQTSAASPSGRLAKRNADQGQHFPPPPPSNQFLPDFLPETEFQGFRPVQRSSLSADRQPYSLYSQAKTTTDQVGPYNDVNPLNGGGGNSFNPFQSGMQPFFEENHSFKMAVDSSKPVPPFKTGSGFPSQPYPPVDNQPQFNPFKTGSLSSSDGLPWKSPRTQDPDWRFDLQTGTWISKTSKNSAVKFPPPKVN